MITKHDAHDIHCPIPKSIRMMGSIIGCSRWRKYKTTQLLKVLELLIKEGQLTHKIVKDRIGLSKRIFLQHANILKNIGICRKKTNVKTLEHIFYFIQNKNLKTMLFFMKSNFMCPMLFKKKDGLKIKKIIDNYLSSIHNNNNNSNEYDDNFFIPDRTQGFIYLLKSEDLIKIGATTNLDARIRAHSANLINEFELIFSLRIKEPFKMEQFFHNKFKDKRFRGEWFRLIQQDIDFIKNFLKSNAQNIKIEDCEYPVNN